MGNPSRRIKKNQKGQSALETAVALVAVSLLVGGILQIWFWQNRQIIRRQVQYNETRLIAGQQPLLGDYQTVWVGNGISRSEKLDGTYDPIPQSR